MSIAMAGSNLLRAEGNAKMAMTTMLAGMILNIILDPILIIYFDMGIKGAAYATILGQAVSTFLVLSFYLRGKRTVRLFFNHLKINWKQFREMCLLGLPNFVQTAGLSLLSLIINKTLLVYSGDMAIGIYGIINRLLSFVIQPVVGISMGFQPIAGYNYGAHQYDRVKNILLIAPVSAVVVVTFFTLLMQLFPYTFIGIFTTDIELIQNGGMALRIMSSLIILMGMQIIFSIYFQAVGKGVHSLLLGLSRQFFILIPLVMVLPRYWGEMGVWLSFPVSDIISTIITAFVLIHEIKQLNKKHSLVGMVAARA